MNYIIYGSSYILIDNEIKDIFKDKVYKTLSLNEVTLQEILDDISYSSMFYEEKNLVLKNFESILESKKDNNDSLDMLLKYLKKPNELTNIIFISNTKVSEKGKWNQEFLKHVKVISTPIITKQFELANVLGETIKKDGYGISQSALNVFATKCALNYDIAFQEFNKLKSIKGENRLISEKDIEEYVSNYNTSDIFDFKDALINKNIQKSLSMLDDLESSKMEVVPIVVMLAKEFETLYNVKSLAEKRLSNEQIGSKLDNMHPYRVKLLRETSSKYTLDELQKHLLYLCNLDLKLISEDNLGFDEIRKFLINL